jgi:hypothetical protein
MPGPLEGVRQWLAREPAPSSAVLLLRTLLWELDPQVTDGLRTEAQLLERAIDVLIARFDAEAENATDGTLRSHP